MGGKGAKRRRTDNRVSNSSVLDEIHNEYTNNEFYRELEILSSNHVLLYKDIEGPPHEEMTDEIFITQKDVKTLKDRKTTLRAKIKELATKIKGMKIRVQKSKRKMNVLKDKPTEYDKERQNFVNNLAAKCSLKMKEFIAGSLNISQNMLHRIVVPQKTQSKQNIHREKREKRSEEERKETLRIIEKAKKEKFFERSKVLEQRRTKNAKKVQNWKNKQLYEEEENHNYRLLLRQMNNRDRNEQRTGIGENPYTQNLYILSGNYLEKFKKNERVIQSENKLTEIHTKRKIERDKIDKEQEELITKYAKTNANAA